MSLPPGPRGFVEVARALRDFTGDPDGYILQLTRRYGGAASMRIGGERIVMIGEPELVGEVLLDKNGVYLKDRVTRDLEEVLGRGLLTSEGALWKRQRKLIAPSLTRKQISAYADAMVRHARAHVETLVNGELRDVHHDLSALTLDIVVETLFGTALAGDDTPRVGAAIDTYMNGFHALVHSWRRLFPAWVPFEARRRNRRAVAELHALVLDVVKAKRASSERGDDLLSRLLVARDEADETRGMDDQQLRDEVITLFVAGHETTANALAWTLLLLAEHPEVDARVAREVDGVLGARAARAEDTLSLPVTEAVLKEAMRLYPPAHIIGREPTADVALGPWSIPKGATVLMSPWAIHRDVRFFDDAEAFRPDRWLDGSTASAPRHAYLPFGGGPRVCVGNHFAMMEATLVLATLVQRVRFERVSRDPVPSQPAVTLRPQNGVPLRVKLRARREASGDVAHGTARTASAAGAADLEG